MVQSIRQAGLSRQRIEYCRNLCHANHLMYGVLYTLERKYPGVRGGFMHVPFIHSQTVNRPAPAPSMSIEDIAAGIEAAIRAIGEHESDIKAAEGATH